MKRLVQYLHRYWRSYVFTHTLPFMLHRYRDAVKERDRFKRENRLLKSRLATPRRYQWDIPDEIVKLAWKSYAQAHFGLEDSIPTETEQRGMRAALESVFYGDLGN